MLVAASVYTDGGVIGLNPSMIGGTWAFCYVDAGGKRRHDAAGIVRPADVGLPTITNNLTELLAAVMALESLPEGWTGTMYTDSLITLYRVQGFQPNRRRPAKFNGIPGFLRDRLKIAVGRLGAFSLVLLGGHPTKADLARGARLGGLPVSAHNVWCDRACTAQARMVRRDYV